MTAPGKNAAPSHSLPRYGQPPYIHTLSTELGAPAEARHIPQAVKPAFQAQRQSTRRGKGEEEETKRKDTSLDWLLDRTA